MALIPMRQASAECVHCRHLINGYLRLGAVVCGPLALDHEFGAADFWVLLDMQKWSREYLGRFGLMGTQVRHAVG